MVNTKKDQFVDREDHIKIFKEAVNNIGQKELSVLVYHGIAGIGKTNLRKEFLNYLEEYGDEYNYQTVILASIDLNLPSYREKNTFLINLKNELQKISKNIFLNQNYTSLLLKSHMLFIGKRHIQKYPFEKKTIFFLKVIIFLMASLELSIKYPT